MIPICYQMDGVECTEPPAGKFDGVAYYNALREGIRVTTSQIPPQRYVDFFTPLLSEGGDVLFVGMSSGISGSYQSAEIAAKELRETFPDRRIRLVDTFGASLGEGLLVMLAAKCREEGMDLDAIADRLLDQRKYVCQLLMVDDLFHLKRTGRVSGASAVIGSVLGIKPILKGSPEGQIVLSVRVRGRKHAIRAMAEKYRLLARDPQLQTVGIAHADCPEDAAYLAELLCQDRPPKEILQVCYEPVTGSHTGPGALALFFMGDADVRLQ